MAQPRDYWWIGTPHFDKVDVALANLVPDPSFRDEIDPNARNARGYTPMHFVVAQGYIDLCKPLLDAGAELNARADSGETPWDVRFAPFIEDELYALGARSGLGETKKTAKEKPRWKWFWAFVDGRGDAPTRLAHVKNALEPLPVDDLVAFHRHWQRAIDEAANAKVEKLAERLESGGSDDGFEDFCAWLVSRGESFYKTARTKPSAIEGPVDVVYEDLLGILFELYAKKTGKEGWLLLEA